MATALRPIRHEDRLSLVEHLDELRSRMIVCLVALGVLIVLCFWQNQALIGLLNVPLERSNVPTADHPGRLSQAGKAVVVQERALRQLSGAVGTLGAAAKDLPAATRAEFERRLSAADEAIRQLPSVAAKKQPVTLGVGEPFTATLTVAAYFGLLLALPILLWQAYAFVLPAFSSNERRVALPLMMLIPLLFVGGVVFAYFLVLPPAINFLQNFNEDSFDVLVQARDYYQFEVMVMVVMGLLFQVPVGILALNRVGILTGRKLRSSWRYAVVIIAIVAALLPGVDPITMLMMMLPLLALYGLSILLVSWLDRRSPVQSRFADDDEDDLLIVHDDDAL